MKKKQKSYTLVYSCRPAGELANRLAGVAPKTEEKRSDELGVPTQRRSDYNRRSTGGHPGPARYAVSGGRQKMH